MESSHGIVKFIVCLVFKMEHVLLFYSVGTPLLLNVSGFTGNDFFCEIRCYSGKKRVTVITTKLIMYLFSCTVRYKNNSTTEYTKTIQQP